MTPPPVSATRNPNALDANHLQSSTIPATSRRASAQRVRRGATAVLATGTLLLAGCSNGATDIAGQGAANTSDQQSGSSTPDPQAQRIAELEAQLSDLSANKSEIEQRLAAAQAQLQKANKELQRQQTENTSKQKTLNRLSRMLGEKRTQDKQVDALTKQQKRDQQRLKEHSDTLTANITSMRSSISALQASIDKLTASLVQLELQSQRVIIILDMLRQQRAQVPEPAPSEPTPAPETPAPQPAPSEPPASEPPASEPPATDSPALPSVPVVPSGVGPQTPDKLKSPQAAGRRFRVDCNAPAGGDGSAARPFKNPASLNRITFAPGDIAMLKAGCAWSSAPITINGAGTAANPITIQGDPTGALPSITAAGSVGGNDTDAIIKVNAPFTQLHRFAVNGSDRTGINIIKPNVTLNRLSMQNHAFAIWIGGDDIDAHNAMVDGVKFKDITNVIDSGGGDDDRGATAVVFQSSNATLKNSECTNCLADSKDYGNEGSFIEGWQRARGLRAHHNSVEDVNNFAEFGADGSDPAGVSFDNMAIVLNEVSGITGGSAYYSNQNSATYNHSKPQNVLVAGNNFDKAAGISGEATNVKNSVNGSPIAPSGPPITDPSLKAFGKQLGLLP